MQETFELMERRFWEPAHGLYADQASADWSQLDPYRGQNANMHACEALLAAFEASGEIHYLQRAETLLAHTSPCARRAGRRHDLGTLSRRLVGGLGLQPPRQERTSSVPGAISPAT
jgi:mannose/cellobiose epimerase-like protein (N-acyl-D-glucosamine 2-epimerase family)